MKDWIKKLLSDAGGLPSTRLHLAWAMAITLNVSIFTGSTDTVVGLIIGGMTTLAGLSVMEKVK